MNTISLVGRLTKDTELSKTGGGISFCRFTVACRGKNKDPEGNIISDFFLCVAWRDKAEIIAQYCKKGSQVHIIGNMASRSYEQNGISRQIWECNVNDIEFLGKPENDETPAKPVKEQITITAVSDEDLPF